MIMVRVSERPRVTKGERQLYVPPGRRDRSRSVSPASITSLDHELSQLEIKQPVQEYRQRFLEHSADSSDGYNVCDEERKLAEIWAQVVEDDRVIREQMEREQAECGARERGVSWPLQEYRQRFAKYSACSKDKEEWEKEEAHIQEQLKPMLEMKQWVMEKIHTKQQAAQEAQAVVGAQTA